MCIRGWVCKTFKHSLGPITATNTSQNIWWMRSLVFAPCPCCNWRKIKTLLLKHLLYQQDPNHCGHIPARLYVQAGRSAWPWLQGLMSPPVSFLWSRVLFIHTKDLSLLTRSILPQDHPFPNPSRRTLCSTVLWGPHPCLVKFEISLFSRKWHFIK